MCLTKRRDCYPDIHDIFSETPLRFTNGVKYIHGTIESRINGQWTQVCSSDFRKQDAYVVCRMSGHKHVRYVPTSLEYRRTC